MKKKESWIIVTNKKTYLLLAIAACIILYLVKAAISTFALKTMLMEDFLGELMVCVLIALSCIYLFVRFNTYSHLYPDKQERLAEQLDQFHNGKKEMEEK